MSFACPACNRAGSLAILASIDLPPDSRSDEIALQVLECEGCGLRGLAIYEESRRGALDSETWDHTGYLVPEQLVDAVHQVVSLCPDPADPACPCPAHREFGAIDHMGRWQAPEGISEAISFPMRLEVARP
jgi:hypothetical protein